MSDKIICDFQFHKRKKGGVSMCKVLNRIQNMTANELLQKYDCEKTIPIDLVTLLKAIGISALPMDFQSIEDTLKRGKILGMVVTNGDNAAIYFRKSDSLNRRRFTIAHELAHCCMDNISNEKLHIEFRIDEDDKNEKELAADIFAGELLIPLDKLKEEYLSLEYPSSEILAEKFGVSISVMEARLNYLKISYYKEGKPPVIYF